MKDGQYVILNVDDSEAGRYSTSRLLTKAGFYVVDAATGTEALERLGEVEPDLVVLDINLPDISGFEVCRSIKEDYSSDLPVLHLSATFVMTWDTLEESSADGYLVQPVEPAVLVGNVNALLRAGRAETELHRQDQEWSGVLDAVQEPLCLIDEGGRIRRASRGFLELVGRSWLELQGLSLGALGRIRVDDQPADLSKAFAASRESTLQIEGIQRIFRVVPVAGLNGGKRSFVLQ